MPKGQKRPYKAKKLGNKKRNQNKSVNKKTHCNHLKKILLTFITTTLFPSPHFFHDLYATYATVQRKTHFPHSAPSFEFLLSCFGFG